MTREFDERHAAKSRAVCRAMDEAHAADGRGLTEREKQILDMWPRFEDTGDYVWFGDRVALEDGSAEVLHQLHIGESCYSLYTETHDEEHLCGERVKRHDSWERLEEDAVKEPCDYFGVECDEDKGCSGCPHLHEGRDCAIALQADLIRRAKALAGVGDRR